MEKVNPSTPYVCTPIPYSETHYDLWKTYKRPDEDLYLVDIPKNSLLYLTDEPIIDSILRYLTSGIYFFVGDLVKRNSTPNWQTDFESYLKYVWLAESYFNNSMKFPIGSHWNPRLGTNVIHPGGARNVIYRLFHSGPVRTVYFNTSGKMFPWLQKSNKTSLEQLEDIYKIKPIFVLTADHGTLIPHIHFNPESIDVNILIYNTRIKNILKNKIYISHPLHQKLNKLEMYFTNDINSDVKITFKNLPSIEDQIKALILFPINFKKIEFENIIIEKNSEY